MIPLRDFVPEWNSCSGTTTGVNARRGDSIRHDISWWYHENKCRAMRENPKVTPVSCSHLLRVVGTQKWPISMAYVLINLSSRPLNAQKIALLLQNTFSINHRFYNLRFYRVLVWLKGQSDYKSMRYKMNKCAKCAKMWTNILVYMQSYLLRHIFRLRV